MNTFKCWHVTKDSVIVTFDNGVKTVKRDSEQGKEAMNLIATNQLHKLVDVVDVAASIADKSGNLFYVNDGMVYSFGERVDTYIENKVIEFSKNNLPFEYLLKFWNNLKQNSFEHVRKFLPEFLENNNYAITQDGMFIAYKRVRNNWKDCWTGTMDNSIGKVVEMKREDCDQDPHRDCSSGLHAAPFNYAVNFYQTQYTDGHVIELLINPIDVMAVPTGCGSIKIRVCKYIVVGEVNKEPEKQFVSNVTITTNDKNITAIIRDGKLTFGNVTIPICEIKTLGSSNEPIVNLIAKHAVNLQEGFVLKSEKIERPISVIPIKLKPIGILVKEMKLGNFKYKVAMIDSNEKDKLLKAASYTYKQHMKPSSWPKSFIQEWGLSIDSVKRYGHSYKHQYVVTLKNGSIFNITSK